MQIKADIKNHPDFESDPLAFTCHPIGKLKAMAALLEAYPEGPWEMNKEVLRATAEIIEDATEEIEYLIEISNERDLKRGAHG